MMKFVGKFLLVGLVGVGIMFNGRATNIANLKGTYSILPEEFRDLSPLEKRIARLRAMAEGRR